MALWVFLLLSEPVHLPVLGALQRVHHVLGRRVQLLGVRVGVVLPRRGDGLVQSVQLVKVVLC